jgi:hypothetical protein
LKQFEHGLNPFKFEIKSDLNRRRPLLWPRPACQWPTLHNTVARAHTSGPPGSPVSVPDCARASRAHPNRAVRSRQRVGGSLSPLAARRIASGPPSMLSSPPLPLLFKREATCHLLFPPQPRREHPPSSLGLLSTLGRRSHRCHSIFFIPGFYAKTEYSSYA